MFCFVLFNQRFLLCRVCFAPSFSFSTFFLIFPLFFPRLLCSASYFPFIFVRCVKCDRVKLISHSVYRCTGMMDWMVMVARGVDVDGVLVVVVVVMKVQRPSVIGVRRGVSVQVALC